MGIVNVTPDSFSDGGRYLDPGARHRARHALLAEGADLLDLGAESTRPGSEPVPADEQWRRLEPVLPSACAAGGRAVHGHRERRGGRARARARGARSSTTSRALARPGHGRRRGRARAPGWCSCTCAARPRTMQRDTALRRRDRRGGGLPARAPGARPRPAGVPRECVAFDPGIGFGKTRRAQPGTARAASPSWWRSGRPLLVGASRKSFLGALTGDEGPRDRLEASLAAAALAVFEGAAIAAHARRGRHGARGRRWPRRPHAQARRNAPREF